MAAAAPVAGGGAGAIAFSCAIFRMKFFNSAEFWEANLKAGAGSPGGSSCCVA